MVATFGDFRFGEQQFGRSGLQRTVTGYSTTIQGDIDRQLFRQATGFSTTIQGTLSREIGRTIVGTVSLLEGDIDRNLLRLTLGYSDTIQANSISLISRTVTGFSNQLQGDSSRDLSRDVTGYLETFGDVDRILSRDITGTVSTIFGTNSRVIDLDRTVTGFSDTVFGDVTRSGITYDRQITGFTDTVFGKIQRSLFREPGIEKRDATFGSDAFGDFRFGQSDEFGFGFVGTLTGDSNRTQYDGSVIVNGFTDSIFGDIDRAIVRVTDGFTQEIEGEVIRFVDLDRSVTGFTDPIVGEVGFPTWRLESVAIENVLDEERSFDSFVFRFIAEKSEVKDSIRPITSEAGKVDIVPEIDGGFRSVDRSDGDNTAQLLSPLGRENVRTVPIWLIEDYEEEPLDTEAKRWEIELELVPEKEKRYDNEYGELTSPPSLSDDPAQWYLQFENGDVLTDKVTTDVSRQPNETFETIELTMFPTTTEVQVIEENLGLLNAQYVRDVPDGKNVKVDESENDRNTVNISAPDTAEDTLDDGEYVIDNWTTNFNQTIYTVTLELVQK